MTAYDSIQFFISLNKENALSISTTGLVCYWKDITLDQPICYKIPLFTNNEQITAAVKIDANEVVLGSSTGEIYVLTIYQDQISVSTIYLHTGIFSYMTGLFRTYLPCRSQIQKPDNAEHILNIKVIGNAIYCVSKKYVSLWSMKNSREIEV